MPATTIVTSAQFLAMPEEYDQNGNRIKDELIAGEIVRMPPAPLRHDWIKTRISRIIGRYLDSHPSVEVEFIVEAGCEVGEIDTYQPDVSVLRASRLSTQGRILEAAPELAIEVVSPSNTAVRMKRKVSTYLQNGAQSVWIVHPEDQSVVVHASDSVRELKGDQPIDDPLLPGFSTPVAAFFA
jgi:Uma2 family endonuclease